MRLGRAYGQDITGEYEPLDHWCGERVLLQSADYHLRVVLHVTVYGSRTGRGRTLRPSRVSAHVDFAGHRETVPDVRFAEPFTLRDVEDAAERGDFSAFVDRALRAVYDKRTAACVSRKTDAGYVPVLSWVAPAWGVDGYTLDFGKYIEVRRGARDDLSVREIDRFGSGYSSSSGRVPPVDPSAHYWLAPTGSGAGSR